MHFQRDFQPGYSPPRTMPRSSGPPVERCHLVYSTLLRAHLTLSAEHTSALLARGLSINEIGVNGYASAPGKVYGENIARALAFDGLEGIPGFYKRAGDWQMIDYGPGFFIPFRDERRRIAGFQVRRDSGEPRYLWFSSAGKTEGTSSGAPVHFAKAHLLRNAESVLITEGALKADVAAYLTGEPVIGIAGVSSFGADFAERLRKSFPCLRRVNVAFDSDLLEKPQVYQALTNLIVQLERSGFSVRVRSWPRAYKGIDDYLLSQFTRAEVA
jgi:hypothetical protein